MCIDLFEMKAYIYNDDKGDDISIEDIPADMADDAELYRTELVVWLNTALCTENTYSTVKYTKWTFYLYCKVNVSWRKSVN